MTKTKTNKCKLPQRAIDVGARVKKSKDGSWAIWMHDGEQWNLIDIGFKWKSDACRACMAFLNMLATMGEAVMIREGLTMDDQGNIINPSKTVH